MKKVTLLVLVCALLTPACSSPMAPTLDLGPFGVRPALSETFVNVEATFEAYGGTGNYTWDVQLGNGVKRISLDTSHFYYTASSPERFEIKVSSGNYKPVIVGGTVRR